jgi:cysteine desulfurase
MDIVKSAPVYLDYAAATPLDEEVFVAMEPYLKAEFYNQSASYLAARKVAAAIEDARSRVAFWLGAKPAEIVFTAGATEANNLALHGIMRQYPDAHAVVLATEHEAVLAPMSHYDHTVAFVDQKGDVPLETLQGCIRSTTVLLSIGYANNEIGTIQPLGQIAAMLREVRAQRLKSGNTRPIYLHTDASQASPYLDLHASRLGVDLMSINAGKVYGPKQVGALYVSSKVVLQPVISGGGQERGLRSGTENVAGIIGLAAALDMAQAARKQSIQKEGSLRDHLQKELLRIYPDLIVNGSQRRRLPNNLNVSWPGRDGERILMACDEQGLLVATGAACSANKQTGSHVLRAIGASPAVADGSIRFSLGKQTTQDDIRQAITIIKEVVV